MLNCFLTNIRDKKRIYLSENPSEVKDDYEYLLAIETDILDESSAPVVMIGDIELGLIQQSYDINRNMGIYQTVVGSFFDNAIFLNYFGECEVAVSINNKFKRSYIVQVNVTGYKASVAQKMLAYLSENAEDILQTCYSKSQAGFSVKEGVQRDVVKLNVLTEAITSIEKHVPDFIRNHKFNLNSVLESNTNKPVIVDENTACWLSENLDELEVSNSSNYTLKARRKHYRTDMPNSVAERDTDVKENRVIHQFALTSLSYLKCLRAKLLTQSLEAMDESAEYDEYVKFDNVIRGIIKPILKMRLKSIDVLIVRVKNLRQLLTKVMPVSRLKGEMPTHTSYTLKNRHYGIVFNQISRFYKTNDADKSNSEFLLGLRNLSQVFELCCLYYLVQYFNQFSEQTSQMWKASSLSWSGGNVEDLNILANTFTFENESFEYSLSYEKKIFSFTPESAHEQEGNLVRIDEANNYYEPDYTIKIVNKSTRDYFFLILDAKFSRSYKIGSHRRDYWNSRNKGQSILQSNFSKYGTNLKTLKNGCLVDATKYVGILYGLSKDQSEEKRINLFNPIHDIDGFAPIPTYSAADFISFSGDLSKVTMILNKYVPF